MARQFDRPSIKEESRSDVGHGERLGDTHKSDDRDLGHIENPRSFVFSLQECGSCGTKVGCRATGGLHGIRI